jgi:hypothetical protein
MGRRMRDISLDVPDVMVPANTFCNYGDTRTGKSKFGATFPRPLIIADVGERGYETVQNMQPEEWFEPDVKPIIKGIDQVSDLQAIIEYAKPLIASGRILSVVFDAFTYYADFYLSHLQMLMPNADGRQIYGKLGTHLQWVRSAFHGLPVNVVWNCLASAPERDEDGTTTVSGGPMIPGKQGAKFAAGVNFLFYTRVEQVRKDGKIANERFELRTKQYKLYAAGSRVGVNPLPDPFVMGGYKDLLPHMGYDEDSVRRALKPISNSTTTSAARPVPVPRPPIRRPAQRPTQRPAHTNSAPKAIPPTGK